MKIQYINGYNQRNAMMNSKQDSHIQIFEEYGHILEGIFVSFMYNLSYLSCKCEAEYGYYFMNFK